jgi:hypothetical protein
LRKAPETRAEDLHLRGGLVKRQKTQADDDNSKDDWIISTFEVLQPYNFKLLFTPI